jgi:Family of unknown function (DUF6496)
MLSEIIAKEFANAKTWVSLRLLSKSDHKIDLATALGEEVPDLSKS